MQQGHDKGSNGAHKGGLAASMVFLWLCDRNGFEPVEMFGWILYRGTILLSGFHVYIGHIHLVQIVLLISAHRKKIGLEVRPVKLPYESSSWKAFEKAMSLVRLSAAKNQTRGIWGENDGTWTFWISPVGTWNQHDFVFCDTLCHKPL